MRYKRLLLGVLAVSALAMAPTTARGSGFNGNPGSLVIFPYYNTATDIEIFSITNISTKTVNVRLVFIDGDLCAPQDHWIELTAKDTFTFVGTAMVAGNHYGFMYAYVVKDKKFVEEVHADVLIGQELVYGFWGNGGIANYTINAATYQGINVIPDGKLFLDGKEYEAAPKTLYFPRFFGQPSVGMPDPFRSKIVLINLTGGQFFTVQENILIYNDNEYSFSATFEHDCFEYLDLALLSGAFRNDFLLNTTHDIGEPLGFAGVIETGWFEMRGGSAVNKDYTVTIDNPSVYALLIERYGYVGYGADLPFHTEDPAVYNHAMLWSTDPNGS